MKSKKILPIILPIIPAATLIFKKIVDALYDGTVSSDNASKYKVLIKAADGTEYFLDEIFDNYNDANEAGEYECSCEQEGYELLNSSNPGDNPYNEDEFKNDFEIIEI